MYVYKYTYIQLSIHTYIHTYIHVNINTPVDRFVRSLSLVVHSPITVCHTTFMVLSIVVSPWPSRCSTMCSAMVNEMPTPTRVLRTDRPAHLNVCMYVCMYVCMHAYILKIQQCMKSMFWALWVIYAWIYIRMYVPTGKLRGPTLDGAGEYVCRTAQLFHGLVCASVYSWMQVWMYVGMNDKA